MQTLLMFGGNNRLSWLHSMDLFRPAAKQWTVLGQMPSERGYGAAAAINGHVYLMGGGTGAHWLDGCLRFDVPTNEWFEVRHKHSTPAV